MALLPEQGRSKIQQGSRVRRRATQDVGLVLQVDTELVDIAFGADTVTVHLDEVELVPSTPKELLVAGQLGDSEIYRLQLQQRFLSFAYEFDPMSGLSNARIEPQPHQVYVAHRVVEKIAPRMILADEVGLGKTIEAGLVLKELRARGLVERVLIITPASLLLQWQQELATKFNETFSILDGDAAKFLGKGGANPFAVQDNVLCSLPFASRSQRAEQIADCEWDLVIFDEAHRVRRTRSRSGDAKTTLAYRLADQLKELSTGLLLLTATPVQLDSFELYSLIELVEPGIAGTFKQFEQDRRRIPELNTLYKDLVRWKELGTSDREKIFRDQHGLLSHLGVPKTLIHEEDASDALEQVERVHPMAGVMVRNRKREIGIVSERRARRIPVNLTPEAAEVYRDVEAYLREKYNFALRAKNTAIGFVMVTYQRMLTSSSFALKQSLLRRADRLEAELHGGVRRRAKVDSESIEDVEEVSATLALLEAEPLEAAYVLEEIETLRRLAKRLGALRDTKVERLLDELEGLLGDGQDSKVVIFTQFIETQNFLAYALRGNNYLVSIFNGRMRPDEHFSARVCLANGTSLCQATSAREATNFLNLGRDRGPRP